MKFEKITTRVLAAAAVVLLILAAALALSSGGVVRVSAGPAQPVSEVLDIGTDVITNTDTKTSPLIATVRVKELTKWQAMRCAVSPSCDTLVLADPLGSSAPADQMATAVKAASAAADTLLGEKVIFQDAPGTGLTVRGIGGPSAGLTLGLHFVNQRTTGDLFAAHVVAATGTLDPTGDVGPVGGVEHKAHGAAAAKAAVLFVPTAEKGQANTAESMEVVGVDSLSDAVDWLCENGATSSACD